MKKSTIKLGLGLAIGFFALTVVAHQMGMMSGWSLTTARETIAENVMAEPVNDECSSATVLTVGSTSCVPNAVAAIAGTTIDADNSVQRANASCQFPGGVTATQANDVWYSFVAQAGQLYTVTVAGAANFDAVVSLYTACGDAANIATAGACSDLNANGGTETVTITAPGVAGSGATTTFLVRVYDWSAALPLGGDFTIAVAGNQPPINDLCANATGAAIGTVTPGGTIGATNDAVFSGVACPVAGPLTNTARPGVFYTTTVTQTGNGERNVRFQTDQSGAVLFDTRIFAFTGTCAAPVCAGADDDAGVGLYSQLDLSPRTTTTFINLVNGFNAAAPGCFLYSVIQLPSITNIAAGAVSGCLGAANTFSVPLTLTYLAAPAGANLLVNGQTFAVTGSPQTITLTNLPANGAPLAITAEFTDAPTVDQVTVTGIVAAPPACSPCVLTCAPVVVNLASGQCNAIVNYSNVTLSPSCVNALPSTIAAGFTGAYAPANFTFASAGDGSVNTTNAPTSITLTGVDNSTPIVPTTYSVTIPAGTLPGSTLSFNWSYTSADINTSYDPFGYQLNGGAFVQLTTNGTVFAQNGTVNIPISAGQVFAFNQMGDFFGRGITTISNFAISSPAATLPCPPVFSIPTGSTFPVGVTPVTVTVDCNGGTSTCTFNVTVNGVANAITTPSCNDLINFTVDQNCTGVITADRVLTGGPYRCFSSYIVTLDKTAPFGNGPWVPAVVGPNDIGKTYYVRVADPLNNNNSCWGTVKIEDKLPPVLTCFNYDLPCNTLNIAPSTLPISLVGAARSTAAVAIPDNTTVTSTAIFSGPPQATIQDVNVSLNITHTYIGDLTIDLIAPNGTIVRLLPPGTCGATANYIVTFDDESPTCSNACLDYTLGLTLQTPQCLGIAGLTTLASFDGGNPNGTWRLRVTDGAAGDVGIINSFAVNITYLSPTGTSPIVFEPCSAVTLTYIDVTAENNCTSGFSKTITRKFTATDASGNSSTCSQTIRFIRPTLANVVCPPSYDVSAGNLPIGPQHQPAFDCNILSGYPTPAVINGLGLIGYPTIFGVRDSITSSANPNAGTALAEACNINYSYDDILIKVCDGTYKIIRNWTILDFCTGETTTCVQIIKVLDTTGPVFTCPANTTVSVNQQNCCAIVNLPDVIITDNCSRIDRLSGMIVEISPFTGDTIAMVPIGGQLTNFPGNNLWLPDTLGAFGITPCLPLGPHIVTYVVTDNCGNTSTCTFRLTVQDLEPPIPSCQTTTTVVVGQDDPYDCYGPAGPNNSPAAFDACTFGGVVKIPAKNFDSGSYDNCNPVAFFVQRMTPYSACINNLNHRNGHPACNDNVQDPTSEFDLAVNENDTIKFYCCEVGTTQTIVLRIYQLTADGNFDHDADGNTIRSECMIQVEVQDKQPPTCIAPPTAVVNCNFFDPTLWAYGIPTIFDNCCLLSTPNDYVYQGVAQCGLKVANNYSNFDTVCNRGTIRRTFTVTDCHNLSTSCTQLVVVNYQQDYFIKFPDDKIVTVCDGTTSFGAPIFQNDQDCELLAVTSSDVTYTVVEDACLKIERTWVIINWCTYNPNLPCIDIPNPNPTIINSQANLTGPTVSACGTPAPWAPTIVRINPSDPTTTNYCTFYQANANCYRYKQIIKIIDGVAPVITCPQPSPDFCAPLPPNTIGFGDQTLNDPLLWNAAYYFDQVSQQHDLCEGPVDLHITATDACSLADITIRYMLFLDLDGDGTMETVINSNTTLLPQAQQPAPGTLQFNNANNPNFSGGTNYTFDFRPVSAGQKYRFALQTTTAGVNKTGFVRWNTLNSPNTYVIPELPYGTHKIKWFVSDGCGNESLCEYNFIVRDCKPPTIVCHALSINAMPNGMVQIWANDFLVYGLDNCTPVDRLKYGIRRQGSTIDPFNTNPAGGINFTCADLNGQPSAIINVEIFAIDLAGNQDYCTTTLTLQDNTGACGPVSPMANVAGALKTEGDAGLEEADVNLEGSVPGASPITMSDLTDENGAYGFVQGVPMGTNLTVTPIKDNNPLNGVTTYDLALISKHILGIEPLNSPYKMIAADANKSGSITAFDIVELRKLILGIYQELPNNTSWRFVDKSFVFPNVANPFQTPFPENRTVANIQASQMNDDFVAMKIGDVNQNAQANAQQGAEARTASTLLIDVEDRAVKSNETFDVTFKTAEAAQAFQFTLKLDGVVVTEIEKGDKVDASNFGVFQDALTTSIDGAQEFTVRFRATKAGKISEMLSLSSRITKAEGYKANGERQEVALRFNQNGTSTISGVGFELYQNEPNPFVGHTSIGFNLPAAATATLTVYDESGRTIFTQKGDFAKGPNAISIDRAVLNTTGMLYYKLETATDMATKKMIQSK